MGATNFPGSLDNGTSLPTPSATDDTNSPSLSDGQATQNNAVIATETKLGYGASAQAPTTNSVLLGTGSGTSQWGSITGAYASSSTGSGNFVLATSPTIVNATLTTPTINNPTLNTDSVVGFTSADNGTVYGIGITSGKITASTSFGTSVILPSALLAGTGTSWSPQSWTPTWTNVTIGNATVAAIYTQIGKFIYFLINVGLGSTSSVSGQISFTLPVTTSSSYFGRDSIGVANMNLSTGSSTIKGYLDWASTTTASVSTITTSTYPVYTPTSATVPFSWTSGSELNASGWYLAA